MLQFPIVKPHSLRYLCSPVWLSFSFPWPAYMRYTHLSFKTHPTLEQCTPTQAHTHSIDCICTAIKLCLTKAVCVR